MVGESNYESNGSFEDENGVRTKKLGPKWKSGKRLPAALVAAQVPRSLARGLVRGPSRGSATGMFDTYNTWHMGQAATQVAWPLLWCFWEARDLPRGLGRGRGRGKPLSGFLVRGFNLIFPFLHLIQYFHLPFFSPKP